LLKRFSVEGYKCFERKVTLNLADVRDYKFSAAAVANATVKDALIYGKNAVGKTSLGKALFDISRSLFGEGAAGAGGVGAGASGAAAGAGSAFLNANTARKTAAFEYEFEFDGARVLYAYEKTGPAHFASERLLIDGNCVFDYDFAGKTWRANNLSAIGAGNLNFEYMDTGMPVLRYVCTNVPLEMLGRAGDLFKFVRNMKYIANAPGAGAGALTGAIERIIVDDMVGALEDFLQSFGIAGRLEVFRDPSGADVLYFVFDARAIPFANNCSSGTAALVWLFDALCMSAQPTLLFIDEFDAFYHFDLAQQVLETLEQNSMMQVILATHNTDLFSNKFTRPDCLFILSGAGIVSAANATKRELREGHNLEKLYKAGEFDAS
jgi:hypothetical protein